MGVGTLYLSLLLALAATTAHSHYVAMFPSSFRPGWDYRGDITVTNTEGGSPVIVQVDILDSKSKSLAKQSAEIQNGGTVSLRIEIPSSFVPTDDNRYSLKLQGTGGLSFTNTTAIELDILTVLTFVQTDKGIYKPSDLVRFRVLTVDKDLKPQKVPRTITVKNPAGSRLRKYIDDGSRAVYEDTFQLTEFPTLGQWKIEVESEEKNIKVEFPFKVDEYVLPKFEVSAKVSPSYLVKGSGETNVTIIVTSKYTYGKGVLGDIKVKMGNQTKDYKILDPSGVREVVIDLATVLEGKNSKFIQQVDLTIEVTDSTQRTYSTSAMVKISPEPYIVQFDKERSDNVYRRGTRPRFVVKVTDPSGKAVGSEFRGNLMVTLKDGSGTVNEHALFPVTTRNMYYVHTFDPVFATVFSLTATATLTVTGKDKTYNAEHYLQRFKTVGNSTLNIRVLPDDPPKMFQDYGFHVDAYPREGFETIRYMVVSRGSVKAQLEGVAVANSFFTVTVTPELCPEVDVIVYGLTNVTSSSTMPEIIADHQTFSLTGCQDKELTPSVPKDSLRTGSNAIISMDIAWTDTRKKETVGKHDVFMLAIDKSLQLLAGSQHDLSPGRVDSELRKFTLGTSSPGGDGPVMMEARIWSPPIQAQTTTGQLLRTVGLTVLSDVAMKDAMRRYDEPVMMEAAGAGGGIMRRKGNQESHDMAERGGEQSADVTAETTTVRKDFPDTWIWKTGQTDENGKMAIDQKLPDTITSWVISAFAIQEDSNLVVTKIPFELAAVNFFFVDLNLPYSIRRNEIFILRCTVFNYDPKNAAMQGMVNLEPSPDFEINGDDSMPFTVMRNSGFIVKFNITAKTVKTINITVTATTSEKMQRYSDIVTKTLIVKPEGEARSEVETMPIVLTASQPIFENEVTIDYSPWTPEQIVPQSKRITAKITADMMGSVLSNIEGLVRQPTGCGEQTMISTVPNIYAMKYLLAIQDTSTQFNDTAKEYMAVGYMRETEQYRHQIKGGYSAWGESDGSNPSTWLTAFVVGSFAQASVYIPETVDLEKLGKDVDYLLSAWVNKNQSFGEQGKVFHDDMQGGSGEGDSLTVYVTMCLMEAQMAGITVDQGSLDTAFEKVMVVAEKVLAIANGNSEEKKKKQANLFQAAITAYTLTLRKPVNVETVTSLINYIMETDAPWKKVAEKAVAGDTRSYYYHKPGPSAIEITSYCILAYLGMGAEGVASASDLVMWLQTKQSSLGGYSSTQDTVLALKAISEYAVVFNKAADSRVVIELLEPQGETFTINIDNSNKRILQIVQLPPETKRLKVTVTGSSETFSMVKVVWDFHTMPNKDKDNVQLSATSKQVTSDLQLVELCLRKKQDFEYNNMMVLTFDFPSCWGLDDMVAARKDNPKVKRLEMDKKDCVNAYLDQLDDACLKFNIAKQCVIQNAHPGSAVAYAYYKPELRAEVDLMMDECTENCGGPTDHATSLSPLSGLLLTAVICLLLSLLVAT